MVLGIFPSVSGLGVGLLSEPFSIFFFFGAERVGLLLG